MTTPDTTSTPPPRTRQQRLPFRPPFFYGWLIVGLAFVASILSGVTSQLFMSIMVKPMSDDLGWSRTEISSALLAGVVATAVLSPWMGRLTDRHGPRLPMGLGSVAVVVGLAMTAMMWSLWQLFASYAISRGFAQTALSGVVPQTAITNWFARMRGRAIGLFGVAFPFAPAILIPAAQWMMDTWGWRSVFWAAGVAITLLVTVPALLLMRRRPEDVGLYPDGAEGPADTIAGGRRRRGGDNNFTATEAMRTPAFWFLVGSQFLGVFISGSVSFHLAAYLGDAGIATAVIGLAISLYSITNGLSSGLWGYLSERISERYIGMGATALGGVIALLLMGVNGPVTAVLLTALYGLGVRGGNSTLGLIIAQYFGRQSYGAINGTLVPIGYVGLGIGPLIGSMLYDASHNYTTFLWMLVALHALNVVFFGLALPPKLPARLANAAHADQP